MKPQEVCKQAACPSTKHPRLLRFGLLLLDYVVFLSPSLLLTCHLSLPLISVCLALEVFLLLMSVFSVCWGLGNQATELIGTVWLCACLWATHRQIVVAETA